MLRFGVTFVLSVAEFGNAAYLIPPEVKRLQASASTTGKSDSVEGATTANRINAEQGVSLNRANRNVCRTIQTLEMIRPIPFSALPSFPFVFWCE